MRELWGNYVGGTAAFGLLILRIVFGAGLMTHGWSKIQEPFSWMKSDEVAGILQASAALGEFGGGLALMLGFLTPLACLGIVTTMVGAWWFGHYGDPWIKPGDSSFELASLYGALGFAMFFTGAGKISIDALLFGRKKFSGHKKR